MSKNFKAAFLLTFPVGKPSDNVCQKFAYQMHSDTEITRERMVEWATHYMGFDPKKDKLEIISGAVLMPDFDEMLEHAKEKLTKRGTQVI